MPDSPRIIRYLYRRLRRLPLDPDRALASIIRSQARRTTDDTELGRLIRAAITQHEYDQGNRHAH